MLHGIELSRPFPPLGLEAGDIVILDEPGTPDEIILHRPLRTTYGVLLGILESGAGTSHDPDESDDALMGELICRIRAGRRLPIEPAPSCAPQPPSAPTSSDA